MTDAVLLRTPRDLAATKSEVGYGDPFTRHVYVYTPPRPLDESCAEIEALEEAIQGMLGRVFA